MPTLYIQIDTLTEPDATTKQRTATYSKIDPSPGQDPTPGWATLYTDTADGHQAGDIDLTAGPAASPQCNLSWALPANFFYNTASPFTSDPTSTDFTLPSLPLPDNTTTLLVTDSNNDPQSGTNYEYRLNLSDGTFIDPRIINR